MKTYFITSDIHSFYKEFRAALKKAGFEMKNPDHILLVIGDLWDRGPDAVKLYNFIKSLPRERRILIRGNHEELLRRAVNRGFFYESDYYNGTLSTVMQFTGAEFYDCVEDPQNVCDKFKENGILEWIASNEWQTYAEIGNYIFVHSWIPVTILDDTDIYDAKESTPISMRSDWREASIEEWEKAAWGCPWVMIKKGLIPKGFTVVCGHWSACDFPKNLDNDIIGYPNNNIYRGHGCIALDACTVRSGFVNVLVLTEDEMKSSKGSK